LLAFVGSKWCPWSQKLEEEILTQSDFIKSAKEDFVLVWLDFPENTLFSPKVKEENWELKEAYDIQELPTLLVVDQDGGVVSRWGYIPMDVKSFVSMLKEAYGTYEQVKKALEGEEFDTLSPERLQELYLKSKKLDCKKFQEKLLEAGMFRGKDSYFLLEKYASLLEKEKKEGEAVELRKKIADLDPKNTQGIHLQLALLDFQKKSTLATKKAHDKSAIEPLLEYVSQFGKMDRQNLWRVEMMIAQHLFSKGFPSKALKHAQASYDSAPEDAKAEIAQSIEYIKAQHFSDKEMLK
jgi:thioredoxin-related protein